MSKLNFIEGVLSNNIGIRKKTVKDIIENGNGDLAIELKKIVETGPTYAKLDALTAYVRIIDKEEVVNVYPFLKSKDWHIRLEAIKGIHLLLAEDSVNIITPFLQDKAYGVRSEVETILKDYQDEISK